MNVMQTISTIADLQAKVAELEAKLARFDMPQDQHLGHPAGNPIKNGVYRCVWILSGKYIYDYYNFWSGSRWRHGNHYIEDVTKNGRWMDCDEHWVLHSWHPLTPDEQERLKTK